MRRDSAKKFLRGADGFGADSDEIDAREWQYALGRAT
jgi:hypothetical protein